MSFMQQVRHVLIRDLRAQRWWLLLFTMLLSLHAAPSWWIERALLEATPATVFVAIGTLLTASIAFYGAFRADVPSDGRPSWVTLPLAPAAVFTAKLAFVLVLAIALPVVTLAPAWWHLDLPLRDIPLAWWQSAAPLVPLLLTVALVAAVVPSGAVVSVLVVLVMLIGGGAVNAFELPWTDASNPAWRVLLAMLACGWGSLVLYRRFRQSHDTRAVRAALTSTGVLALLLPLSAFSNARPARRLADVFPEARLTVGEVTVSPISIGGTPTSLAAQRDSSVKASLSLAAVPATTWLNGVSTVEHHATTCGDVHRSLSGFPRDPRVALPVPGLPDGYRSRVAGVPASTTSTSDSSIRTATGVAPMVQVSFFARANDRAVWCRARRAHFLEIAHDSSLAVLPVQDGAVHRANGSQLRLRLLSTDTVPFALDVTRAATRDGRVLAPRTQLRAVLVNASRHETVEVALQLDANRSQRNLSIVTERWRAEPIVRAGANERAPWWSRTFESAEDARSWLENATLHVIERRFEEIDITAEIEGALERARSGA